MRGWVYNPHAGGRTVPPAVRLRTEQRLRKYAETRYGGRFRRLDIRFRGALCYVDAWIDPTPTAPVHLCRLRYFGNEDAWTLAFFTYSDERYSPCVFHSGSDHGTPEEALDVGAIYLPEPCGEVGMKRGRSRPTRSIWTPPVKRKA